MKNKKQKPKYLSYCQNYLMSLYSEAVQLKEGLEEKALALTAKQELIDNQIMEIEEEIAELEEALSAE